MAVEILVDQRERGCGQMQGAQTGGVSRDCDLPGQTLQSFGEGFLIPESQRVAAWRYLRDGDLAVTVRHSIVGRGNCNHHRAHLRMDVAKNVRNAGLVKDNIADAAGLVQAQIKALSVKKRKHIVKKWITIGELHHRTDRDD